MKTKIGIIFVIICMVSLSFFGLVIKCGSHLWDKGVTPNICLPMKIAPIFTFITFVFGMIGLSIGIALLMSHDKE